MDAQICTKIVWMITRNFSGDPDELIKIRRLLASAIFMTDGKGFPKPADPPQDALGSKAWAECSKAVLDISDNRLPKDDPIKSSKIKFVLFAPSGADGKADLKATDLGITWPATSKEDFVAGPVSDGNNRKIYAVGYSHIDQEQAFREPGLGGEGLYPVALRSVVTDSVATSSRQQGSASAWALFIFIVAILCGSFSMLWIYGATEQMHERANELLMDVSVSGSPKSVQYQGKSIKEFVAAVPEGAESDKARFTCLQHIQDRLANSSAVLDTKICNDVLFSTREGQSGETVSRWGKWVAFFSKSNNANKSFSLFVPLILTQIAIILLIVSAGLAKRGHVLGSFIDERNRISLSGAQQLLWTVVLFGGFTILGIFNIALLADFVRIDTQHRNVIGDALTFFPAMDPALWAVLGITVALSPYLSRRFQSIAGNLGTVEVRQSNHDASEQRNSPAQAHWTDLFTDEKQAGVQVVDVSRLQHMVITGLLLGGYFIMLAEYIRNVDAIAICIALLTGSPVFTYMPPVDATFIGLLTLSHAGYLAFKALPQTPGAGAAKGN